MFLSKLNALFIGAASIIPLDVISGLEQAKNKGLQGIKDLMSKVIVPIIIAVLVIMLVVELVGFVRIKRTGEDSGSKTIALVGTVALLVIFGSWYAWGNLLFDTTAGAAALPIMPFLAAIL